MKTADELKKLQLEGGRRSDQCSSRHPRRLEAFPRGVRTGSSPAATRTSRSARRSGPSTRPGRRRFACARSSWPIREWERAASEIRRLQAEWKTVGPVRRSKSEALWQRFRGACDLFFERYKRRDEIEIEARQADRESLAIELEGRGAARTRHNAGPSR